MNSLDSVTLNNKLTLQTPTGYCLSVQLKEVALYTDEKKLECHITFTVSLEIYTEIEKQRLFHLETTVTDNYLPEEFSQAGEIEIEVKLQSELIFDLLSNSQKESETSEQLAESVAEYLLYISQNQPSSPLLFTDNWYALSVMQEVPLPGELDTEILKTGYQTTWETNYLESPEEEEEETIYQITFNFFQSEKLPFWTIENEEKLGVTYRGDNGEWDCYIVVKEVEQICSVYGIFPETIPQEKLPTVAEFLMRINTRLLVGNFELNFDTGEIYFKTSIDVEGDCFSEALLHQLFYTNAFTTDCYFPEIYKIIAGDISQTV
ncbi:MAG: YbjN domain-containing protein [Cyanobacteria bacterium J06633_8]